MKRHIITMLVAICIALGITAQNIALTHVQTVPYSVYNALDKEGNLLIATKAVNGDNTVTFCIYDQDLTLIHSFTSKQKFQFKKYEASWGNIKEYVATLYDGKAMIDADVILTQGLFNDDDEWEFVIQKTSYTNGTNEYTDEYSVYKESGTKLELPKVEGSISRYIANGSRQYVGYLIETPETDVCTYYSAKSTDSARMPELNDNKVSVVPNPVHSGKSFDLRFASALTKACIMSIFNLDGTVVYTSDIQVGECAKTVPANTLAPGMYIYTVSSSENIIQSGKIIAQ